MNPRALGAIAAICAFAIDQGNKFWMMDVFGIEGRQPIRVLPILDIVMVWNKGISYGMLRADAPWGPWALLAFSLAVTVFFAFWLWRARTRIGAIGLGLVIGAALANAFDRLVHGAVADFYHFHTPFPLGPLSNYVFNLADVAIIAGVLLILYESLLKNPEKVAGNGR